MTTIRAKNSDEMKTASQEKGRAVENTDTRTPHKMRRRGPRPSPARACTVATCPERAYADRAYCPMHQLRYERTGDPLLTRKRGPKSRSDL